MNSIPYNPFYTAQDQVDNASRILGLDQATTDFLRQPMREYQFSIPVRLDDGSVKIFRGYRIHHNDARGPCRGGVRFHTQKSADILRAIAMWMTWKSAVVDVPLGGSAGGVTCDPHSLTHREQERLCRGWVRMLAKNVGPLSDIPSPDIMTNSQHMLWMLDEYEVIHGSKFPGFTSGKPIGLGGSQGKEESAGFGAIISAREALREKNLELNNTSASVQGFGNVGRHAFQLYSQMGGTVTSVASWHQADSCAYTYRKNEGIEYTQLIEISNHFGEINKEQAQESGYEILPGHAWLEQSVDLLIPAAMENQITPENFELIKPQVRFIVEGANGPTSPEIDGELQQRGILIIPDLLANAGGAVCSYLEQVQSNSNHYWHKEEVLAQLDFQMTSAYRSVSEFSKNNNLSLREAAHLIAIEKVARACLERGWT